MSVKSLPPSPENTDGKDHAEKAAQVFVSAVAKSMDELEERIVEVTGIENGDGGALVVGRVTFSPEVERIRKGMMPGPNGESCVRTPRGPLNHPTPSLDELSDLFDVMDVGEMQEAVDWTDPSRKVPTPPKPERTPFKPKDTPALSTKDTNPKDAVGTKKWRQYCTVPTTIIWELGVAMLEGARKYGRHNYRIAGVRASVYIDAAKGHIDQWWEGEDIDEESKLNHIIKAIASLAVLRDAMIHNKWVDDRPPKTNLGTLRANLQEAVDGIFERIPVAKDAYLEGDQYDK